MSKPITEIARIGKKIIKVKTTQNRKYINYFGILKWLTD